MTIKHFQYAQLLYDILISQKRYTVEFVARRTGTPPSTIYKYCEGTLVVPVEFQSKIYNATGDIDFLNFTIDDTDKVLIDRLRGEGKKSVLEETLDVASASGKLIARVQKALDEKSEEGKDLSNKENKAIDKDINSVIKELEDLRVRKERGN
jgi:hypothetical protein